MPNISLIFTRHREDGNCNSIELLKIIERIEPEIIFEELSNSNYDLVYKGESLTTLESNAVKMYLQSHEVDHIPVDTFDFPSNFNHKTGRMLNSVVNSITIEARDLRNLLDHQLRLIAHHDFSYLNSSQNDTLFEKMDDLKGKILKKLNNENLYKIAKLEKEVIGKREDIILDNIYAFSKAHKYNQALLCIGSGHRKSMLNKINERERKEKLGIKWTLFEEENPAHNKH